MSTPPPPTPYTLPPTLNPETLETLPILTTILNRLSIPSTSAPSTQQQLQPTSQPSAISQTSSPPVSTPSQPPHPASSSATASATAAIVSGTGALQLKDIPLATDTLKHKIQRARAQVKELPDVERSIREQEEEMRELEERIREQRAVLRGLRERSGGLLVGREEVVEDGMDMTGS